MLLVWWHVWCEAVQFSKQIKVLNLSQSKIRNIAILIAFQHQRWVFELAKRNALVLMALTKLEIMMKIYRLKYKYSHLMHWIFFGLLYPKGCNIVHLDNSQSWHNTRHPNLSLIRLFFFKEVIVRYLLSSFKASSKKRMLFSSYFDTTISESICGGSSLLLNI